MADTVVRIVNLDDNTTENELKALIKQHVHVNTINDVFIRKDETLELRFAYVVFQSNFDAKQAVAILNQFTLFGKLLKAELIGPTIVYKKYTQSSLRAEQQINHNHGKNKIKKRQIISNPVKRKTTDEVREKPAKSIRTAVVDKNVVKCRSCNGDHWTSKCPWKDTMLVGGKVPDEKKLSGSVTSAGAGGETGKQGGSKYIPPSMRDGAARERMAKRDDSTIRITNLCEFTTDSDLQDMVKQFGPINKMYLAKHKKTGHCKGFAYINFKFRNDAADAIARLNGHSYYHLILSVDWC